MHRLMDTWQGLPATLATASGSPEGWLTWRRSCSPRGNAQAARSASSPRVASEPHVVHPWCWPLMSLLGNLNKVTSHVTSRSLQIMIPLNKPKLFFRCFLKNSRLKPLMCTLCSTCFFNGSSLSYLMCSWQVANLVLLARLEFFQGTQASWLFVSLVLCCF